MADYYQLKNSSIFNPPANTNLGNSSNQFGNVFVQNNLNLGNVTVTSSTIVTPKVSSIGYPGDDTAADTAGGQTITLTGSGFTAGASVLINGSAVGVVSVVSSTTITFTSPANSTGSYVIYVINPDGATAISIPGIQYSGTPNWTTAAGSLGGVYETNSFNQTVTATGDAPITYAVTTGSLPPGATFNSNGTITGTSQLLSSPTTYTFTVRATDAQKQDTDRSFSIVINPDVVTWSSPANNTTYTQATNVAISNITLSATSAVGSGITYSANTLPTGLSLTGANISGTPTVVANTSSLLTATANTTSESSSITINWTVNLANDAYFMYNSLLLPGNGTNNAQNNTFLDSSTNNFTVTRNGNPTQGTVSPYGSNWSIYFDGSGDYLSVPSTTALQFGTGDFTVESWVYLTATPSAQYAQIIGRTEYGTNADWMLQITNANKLTFYLGSTASFIVTSTAAISLNTWTHVAVSRSGSSFKLFINGTIDGTATNSGSTDATGSGVYTIGSDQAGDEVLLSGYLSNLRAVKGTAIYTSNFTPSTAPLTAISGTSLLTCQSNRLVDNSTNNFTISKYGDTRIQRFSPFGSGGAYNASTIGGSAYFDGSGDYLDVTSSSVTLSANWTIECWFQTVGISAIIFDTRPDGSNGFYPMLTGNGNDSQMNLLYNSTDHAFNVGTYTQFWNHVAVVKNSGTLTVYFNGVSVYSVSDSNTWSIGTNRPRLGANGGFLGGAPSYYTGYISDFRIVNGTAVYTTAFTPPTAPLTAITNTRLLYKFTNAGIIDNTMISNLETVGDAKISTAQSKFGSSSLYFDGTADSLNILNNYSGILGTGNFTVEAWVYTTISSGTQCVYDMRSGQTDGTSIGFFFGMYNSNSLLFYTGGALVATGGTVPANTWTHIALVRVGNAITCYINGTSVATGTTTNNFTSTMVQIGSSTTVSASSVNYFNGYIDDLRVTRGYARYTSNFTPPTSAFPTY